MIGRAALNGHGDKLPGNLVAVFLNLLLILPDLHGLFVHQLALQDVQHVLLGLLGGKRGNFLQHVKLALLHGLGLFQALLGLFVALVNLFFLALHAFQLAFQALLFLQVPPLLVLNLLAPVGELLFRLVSQAVYFILALQHDLLFPGLGGFHRAANDPLGLLLGGADGGLRLVFTVADAQEKAPGSRRPGGKHGNDDAQPYRYLAQTGTSFFVLVIF